MLKRYSQLFVSLLIVCDLFVIAAAWMLAYAIRFGLFSAPLGVPPFEGYARRVVLILPIFLFCFTHKCERTANNCTQHKQMRGYPIFTPKVLIRFGNF